MNRDVDFKKVKVNLKDKVGKERENSNTIYRNNQLPTINKDCEGDVNKRSCNTVEKRNETRFEKIKSKMKNIFKEKGKKEEKVNYERKLK